MLSFLRIVMIVVFLHSNRTLAKTLRKIKIIETSLGLPNYFFLPPFFSFLSSHLSLAIPTLSFFISLLLYLSMRSRLIHVPSFMCYRLELTVEHWTHASPIFLPEKRSYFLGSYFNPPENPFEPGLDPVLIPWWGRRTWEMSYSQVLLLGQGVGTLPQNRIQFQWKLGRHDGYENPERAMNLEEEGRF